MRYVMAFIFLCGCTTVEDLHADKYEGVCARQCLASNSVCIGSTALAMQSNCNANARQCLSTCPAN